MQGRCCDSFPSGEVTLQASFVTPFIANYARDYPWVWALEALPAYDALARLKTQEHWQTDVIAGRISPDNDALAADRNRRRSAASKRWRAICLRLNGARRE